MNQLSIALATLANRTGIVAPGISMTRGGYMISLRLQAAIQSLSAGDGPHSLWLVNQDLTLAEFEAYLEIQGPLHPNDTTKVETATRGRKLRYLGMLTPVGNGTVSVLSLKDVSVSGLKWSEETAGWRLIIYNEGRAMTTGATFSGSLQAFVKWNQGG